ncbi:MAG TPA: hypothetical protein VN281_21975 [Verrucomicrobiae bacterium]|nr:hypothetical protein [Verrucomicrobiae bacterium]
MKTLNHTIASILPAAAIGFLAGWVDSHNDEPQAAVLVLLVLGGLLGLTRPRLPWLCAVIAAFGIPAVYVVRRAMDMHVVSWPQPNLFATLLALIPSFIGIYSGLGARKVYSLIRWNGVE